MSDIRVHKSIALVGSPNSGKTTLFNWLTGSNFNTVNYPGSTVDYCKGKIHSRFSAEYTVIDTPGSYSVFPKTSEEEVTLDLLKQWEQHSIDKVVVVADGTQLARHLFFAHQIKDMGFDVVLAITMADLLRKEQVEINLKKLEAEFDVKCVLVDGVLGGGVKELVEVIHQDASTANKTIKIIKPYSDDERKIIFSNIESLIKLAVNTDHKDMMVAQKKSLKIDKVLLHPMLGGVFFIFIMTFLFSSIFWLAAPAMDMVDSAFGAMASFVNEYGKQTLFADFVANGVIASFGAVLVFVPQIFILFLGIGLLEDSGYLSRAATIVDKPFSKIGLNGRSFVPLLSGFACAVPAMMAARTVGSKKEKFITLFIIPFMTCSARLPVYALLLSFLFQDEAAWKPGLTLAAIYIGAIVVASVAAGILNLMIKQKADPFFVMELPIYRMPLWRIVIKNAILRTKSYVKKAGPVIFVLALIVWLATTFPQHELEGTERLAKSYAGQAGQVIEPVFKPLGADWRVGVGLITAFAAREVFVSSLAVMFNITDDLEEEQLTASLIKKMQSASFADGTPIFTFASVMALIVFFMIALQCISTTGVAIREMGSWKAAVVQLVVMNVLAYVMAVITYQVLA